MTQRSTRRVIRQAFGTVSVAAILAACGGGVGEIAAILSIVTPLGGTWGDEANKEGIAFLTPAFDDQVFSSQLDVTARFTSSTGVCGDAVGNGVNVEGRLENGKLTLRPAGVPAAANCIEGSFTDLRRFDAVALGVQPPKRSYTNGQVFVTMDAGLWVSENGKLVLKFEKPFNLANNSTADVTGCDVSNTAAKVNFIGKMQGFDVATLTRPFIPDLRNKLNNTIIMFTVVDYVDGATLKLRDGAGQSVTLQRKPDPANTVCPP
jgi:hypothetical protein